MTKTFKYSVLKYVHSQFLGEELNIGIIFLFPNQNKLVFQHPSKVSKFKNIYRGFPELNIKEYLKVFKNACQNIFIENNYDLDKIINDNFIVKDSSSLRFTPEKSVVLYSDDSDKIVDQYFRLYFPEEFPNETQDENSLNKIKRIYDRQISTSYKNLLSKKDKEIIKFLKPPIEIKSDLAHFRSDLVWQNHTTNAVKGLSLDLLSEDSITDKALLYNAKLNYLANEANDKNIRFDLIIAEPSLPSLKGAYENALEILHDIKAPKEIITPESLDAYTQRTILELER